MIDPVLSSLDFLINDQYMVPYAILEYLSLHR